MRRAGVGLDPGPDPQFHSWWLACFRRPLWPVMRLGTSIFAWYCKCKKLEEMVQRMARRQLHILYFAGSIFVYRL